MTETAVVPATVEAPLTSAKSVPKKAASSKKSPAKPRTHPPVSEMVNAAIAALKDKRGSSLQAIKKYIAATYKVDVEKQSTFIKKYLKLAVTKKTIVQTKGSGAAGSFKLAAKGAEGEKKVVKKPVAKKPAAKAKKPVVKKAVAVKKSVAVKKQQQTASTTTATTATTNVAAKKVAAPKPKVAVKPKSPSKAKKTGKAPAAAKPKTPKPKKAAAPKVAGTAKPKVAKK
ncbi:PREDICTED: histone H1-like [Ceratosolen solmsi marchali]|uniref:Histone H1-like n=1 Tax=Ceratosolen solmsi marchali TaxID=326594 RepID=A0AAJ6YPI6_9HYME|nr:PREDICTED: histone H1-like [Ceratosolen solmsi marchali]